MEKHPNLAEEFIAKYFRKRDNENRDKNSQEATPPGEQESQTQPIDNGSQDSQPQPIGNEGGDTQPQSQIEDTQLQPQVEDSQPIGNGGEDSQTEPQA